MRILTAEFLKSARRRSEFPSLPHPEFAFMGRSNVGKSSLINMVAWKKGLVRVGGNPGVTRTVNFFLINGNITLVDLPGYGYARLPLEIRKTFLPLLKSYIEARDRLRMVFMLVDIRRVPDESEREMITLLTARKIPCAICATKCDKLTRNHRVRGARAIAEALEIEPSSVFMTSARTGEGRREMLRLIEEYAAL